MRVLVSLTVAVVLAAAGTAHAQPEAKDPDEATNRSLITPLVAMSAGAALMVAANGTDAAAVGLVLFVGGGIAGPAVGHWYGGKIGGVGIATRTVATVAMFFGFLSFINPGGDEDPDQRFAGGVMAGAALMFTASAIYDIVQADDVAESWNRRHGVTFTPTVVGRTPGAAVSIRF